jgi:hypothetical protein
MSVVLLKRTHITTKRFDACDHGIEGTCKYLGFLKLRGIYPLDIKKKLEHLFTSLVEKILKTFSNADSEVNSHHHVHISDIILRYSEMAR